MRRRGTTPFFVGVIIVLVVVIAGLGLFLAQELQIPLPVSIPGISGNSSPTPTATSSTTFTPTGVPHVVGTQLVDVNGHPLQLRGAQIESPFNYIKGWDGGKTPAKVMNAPTTFQVMAQQWHMNALRLPISNWIYAKDSTSYLNQLDEVVQEANSAYTLEQVEHLKRFDQFGLLMIEQPLWHDDFYFHAQLQRQLKTSICLDEAIHSRRDARAAIELGACRIINIKVGRVGGFSEAVAVHNVAQQNKVPVWCGGMLESGIGRSHNIALSTLPNFTLPGDVSASKRYWKEDIIEPAVEVSSQGFITVPNSPGRGFALKKVLIEKLTVRKQTLSAGVSSAAD